MNYFDYGSSSDIFDSYSSSGLVSSSTSGDVPAEVFGFLGGLVLAFLGIIIVITSIISILKIIGMWKVFTKAGEKGWKSLIPFYNTAILFKISGMSPYFAFIYLGLLIPGVNFLVPTVFAVFMLYQKINLMKAFKSSTGLTVAMIMVPFITYLILGFGDHTYYGFGDTPTETPTEQPTE